MCGTCTQLSKASSLNTVHSGITASNEISLSWYGYTEPCLHTVCDDRETRMRLYIYSHAQSYHSMQSQRYFNIIGETKWARRELLRMTPCSEHHQLNSTTYSYSTTMLWQDYDSVGEAHSILRHLLLWPAETISLFEARSQLHSVLSLLLLLSVYSRLSFCCLHYNSCSHVLMSLH